MKSIIQEGPSIGQAIELAWKQAGKPKDFSVKVYEDAEKILFIFTRKPAKIGFFFEDSRPKKPQGRRSRYYRQRDKRNRPDQEKTGVQQESTGDKDKQKAAEPGQKRDHQGQRVHRGPRDHQGPRDPQGQQRKMKPGPESDSNNTST